MKKIIGISYILILLLSLTAYISSIERKSGKEDVRVDKKLICKTNLALSIDYKPHKISLIIVGWLAIIILIQKMNVRNNTVFN